MAEAGEHVSIGTRKALSWSDVGNNVSPGYGIGDNMDGLLVEHGFNGTK